METLKADGDEAADEWLEQKMTAVGWPTRPQMDELLEIAEQITQEAP